MSVQDGKVRASFEVTEGPAGEIVLVLRGEFDIITVGPLDVTVRDVLVGRPPLVVFDLGGVEFMDSSAISVLVTAARASTVRLRHVPPLMRRVIQMTGLDEVLAEEG